MQRPPFPPRAIEAADSGYRLMTRVVPCLDNSVRTLLDGLGDRADNTLVFYLSDNGFLHGEHRALTKWVPYEESVRVPFAVRYPPLLAEADSLRVARAGAEHRHRAHDRRVGRLPLGRRRHVAAPPARPLGGDRP